MTNLSALAPKHSKKDRKRKGQGSGTGNGTFAGRGCKGQNSRSGGGVRLGFEGGQSGLLARMPKMRGFNNPNRVEAQIVNVGTLNELYKDGETVSIATLIEKGAVRANNSKVKILGKGECSKKLTVDAGLLISASAKALIEKAGGKISE